jgi:hypothetical protein
MMMAGMRIRAVGVLHLRHQVSPGLSLGLLPGLLNNIP